MQIQNKKDLVLNRFGVVTEPSGTTISLSLGGHVPSLLVTLFICWAPVLWRSPRDTSELTCTTLVGLISPLYIYILQARCVSAVTPSRQIRAQSTSTPRDCILSPNNPQVRPQIVQFYFYPFTYVSAPVHHIVSHSSVGDGTCIRAIETTS